MEETIFFKEEDGSCSISIIDHSDHINSLYERFNEIINDEIIPLFKKDEVLNNTYIEEKGPKLLLPLTGYFENVTKRFIIKINENAFVEQPEILEQVKSILNKELGVN